jgi:hypothetical protein
VILCVIHATSESEMKETLACCGFYGSSILEDYMWTNVIAT